MLWVFCKEVREARKVKRVKKRRGCKLAEQEMKS